MFKVISQHSNCKIRINTFPRKITESRVSVANYPQCPAFINKIIYTNKENGKCDPDYRLGKQNLKAATSSYYKYFKAKENMLK